MTGETRVCLDLFSGLGGFSAAFDDADGWRVVTVDLDPDGRFDPDLRADVLDLRPADLVALIEEAVGFPFDDVDVLVVLASPPCTQFSTVGNHSHWDHENKVPIEDPARDAVALIYHTLGLIHGLSPRHWFLENPLGRLRWFLGKPTGAVSFCQYGRPYMKPTDLWGDHPPMTYRRCQNGDGCHKTNRPTRSGGLGNCDVMGPDPAERAKVPYELSAAIHSAVEDALAGAVYEQTEIGEVTEP